MKPEKAEGILQAVPWDRLLLESDAPDALPHGNFNFLTLGARRSSCSGLWISGDIGKPFAWRRNEDKASKEECPQSSSKHRTSFGHCCISFGKVRRRTVLRYLPKRQTSVFISWIEIAVPAICT